MKFAGMVYWGKSLGINDLKCRAKVGLQSNLSLLNQVEKQTFFLFYFFLVLFFFGGWGKVWGGDFFLNYFLMWLHDIKIELFFKERNIDVWYKVQKGKVG